MKKIIASAGSKEDLQRLINEFYFSQNYIIDDNNKIINSKRTDEQIEKLNSEVEVIFKKDRWRFEFKKK